MELMSPEEQARKLREQVGESLGIAGRVTEDNIARGLAALQGQVDSARESGDADAEEAALERLISAQDRVSDLRNAANGLSDVTAQSGELGSIARLFNQVSGRDPNERSAESLSNLERSSQDQITRLDLILGKMDVQPDVYNEFPITP
jgi:translation elongation factor EF-1beta